MDQKLTYLYGKIPIMISKAQLQQTIDLLPNEVTLEELIDKLILLDKIYRGDKDSKAGNTVSEHELNDDIEKWSK